MPNPGTAGDIGFSMPMSFIVAWRRSRSRRSSSSSVVSSFRAPVIEFVPALRVKGRRWALCGSTFFSPSFPLKSENPLQSNESDRRDERVDGAGAGGLLLLSADFAAARAARMSSKVVSRSG